MVISPVTIKVTKTSSIIKKLKANIERFLTWQYLANAIKQMNKIPTNVEIKVNMFTLSLAFIKTIFSDF